MDQLLKQEIATVARDITYPAFGGVLRHQDDTLLTRGGGRGLLIYDDIERDCEAYAVLQKRKMAVISRPWQVDPASPSRADKKAADLVKAQLDALDFDHVCLNLLDALLKGYAVGEVMWSVEGAEIVATEIKPRDQRRFGFDDEYKLRLKTFENMLPGMALPDRKFIVHSFGAKDGNPYGLGLGSRLFWPVFFKRQGITFWLTFVDKFGSPTAVGKYPNGSQLQDQKKLLDALSAIAQDAGVIVPEGMVIELLEATRGGATDTYEKLARYMDEQITMAVLGEAPIARGSGGQAASAAITRNEVRLELVQADSDMLSGTLNKTLVAWITELNCPGATPPRVWRKVEEQKDLGAVATRDKTIFDMGFKPSLAYINETYGGEWTEKPIVLQQSNTPAQQIGDLTAFSEVIDSILPADLADKVKSGLADQQAMKGAASKFAEQYQALLGSRLDDLFAMLEESGDLATFREHLADLIKQDPPQALTDSLTNAGFNAGLLGASK
jgi:phage gp29-like protein